VISKSEKDLMKKLAEGEKRRKKREEKEQKEMNKKLAEGEKRRKKREEEFLKPFGKSHENREKRELLENAHHLQKIKMQIKWALFGYKSKV